LAIRNTHPPRRTLPASGQPTNGVGGSEPITAGHRALMTHSLVTRPPPVTPLAAGDQHAGIELWQRARAAIAKGSVAYSPIKRLPTTDAIASHRIDPGMGAGFTFSVGKTEISVIFFVFGEHRDTNFGPESL